MRRRLLFVAVAAAAAALVSPSIASADGPYDFAEGGGTRPTFVGPPFGQERHFAFSAHETDQGVTGHFNIRFISGFTFGGDVTCVFVVGNQAVVGGIVTQSDDPSQEGTAFAMAFEDNGPPPGPGPPTDRASLTDIFSPPPADEAYCAAQSLLFGFLGPMSSGNVDIYDAPA